VIGYIYLDLYPREGKYTHAATFEIKNTYKDINNNRIIPITAIVCNFSLPENNKNYSLLTFSEIVTFCHELGHAFHNILSNVKYEGLSGISVEMDFAEAPSQFFENWCYEKEFLRKISKHYITNKKMPNYIIDKIINNRNFMNSIHYLNQILFIKYDLNVHKNKIVDVNFLNNEWNKLSKDLLPFKSSKNIYPECRFDHIIEYSVGYYGYLFSIIYSYNAFSIFKKYGIFNKKLGKRFRKEILEKGSTIKGIDMLENFLQTKKSEKYFYDIFK
jgi:Zn-dependent oligopeptidase